MSAFEDDEKSSLRFIWSGDNDPGVTSGGYVASTREPIFSTSDNVIGAMSLASKPNKKRGSIN